MTVRVLQHAAGNLGPLGQNAAHKLAQQHALCHYASGTIYSFIPKNGCSTLRYSLAWANGCIDDEAQFYWIHENNGTFSASLAELARARYTFVVLRCPYARLASVFLDKIVNRGLDTHDLERLNRKNLDIGALSFRGFVELLEKPAVRSGNIHWRPQSDFLVYKAYDSVFCLESFHTAIPEIEERSGIRIRDARGLTAHGTDRFTLLGDTGFADVPAEDILALQRRGECPSHRAMYDARLQQSVQGLYAADLKLYTSHLAPDGLMFPLTERQKSK